MSAPTAVGDRVCYSRVWLRATGLVTGHVPFMRGTVIGFESFGSFADCTLAVVRWDVDLHGETDGVGKVLTSNLHDTSTPELN